MARMAKGIAFLTFLLNLVTTEKSVERLAAASDSHAALQAAANNSPTLAAKSPQIIYKTVVQHLKKL